MLFFLTLISILNSLCTDTQTLSNLMQYILCTLEGFLLRDGEFFLHCLTSGKNGAMWGEHFAPVNTPQALGITIGSQCFQWHCSTGMSSTQQSTKACEKFLGCA